MSAPVKQTKDLPPEEKRALVAQLLRAKANKPRSFPLSFAQQRLWFLNQLMPDLPTYNISVAVQLAGQLDLPALEQALHELVDRHEILRTTFSVTDGQPLQVVAPVGSTLAQSAAQAQVTDLRSIHESVRNEDARRLIGEEVRRPFDLERGPLLRLLLLRTAEAEHVLLLTMHHIISDGWSMNIFIEELGALYGAYREGNAAPLPALPIQYADFAVWQRDWLQGEALDNQLAYWKRQLDGIPATLDLPIDHSRPAVQSFNGARHGFVLPSALAQALSSLSRRADVSLFMTLLAAFQVLLVRYSGQHDIVLGLPIANRHRSATEGLIGLFTNTLVLRGDLSRDPSFRELLGRVREAALGAYAHQDLPFEKLVEALQPQRDMSRTPLFQVMFNLQNAPLATLKLADLTLSPFEVESRAANFDLVLSMIEVADVLAGSWEYNSDLFEPTTIARMADHFRTLLEGIVDNPDRRLSHLPLLSADEREQLLVTWNDTAVAYPPPHTLPPLLAAQAERSPDAAALQAADFTLSFQALYQKAARLAAAIQRHGAGPDTVVALALPRSPDFVLALLATIQAGAAFLPLDLASPSTRLAFILQDAQPSLLLTTSALRQRLPTTTPLLCLDAALGQSAAAPLVAPALHPEHLAYLLYTSGSTGNPKGVLIGQRAIVNRLRWMQASYQLGPSDRVLHKTSAAFDVAVWELCWPLLSGGTLVLAPPDAAADLALLSATISAQRITVLHFVPSVLALWLAALSVGACGSLRLLISSGEALESSLAARALSQLEARLDNLYGPTEAAIDVSCWPCPRPLPTQPVPIGHPIANTQLYVLDAHMQPAPIGVLGELYLGGLQLARGYHNRPELTAERFVPNPFAMPEDERRKTKDEACDRSFVLRPSSFVRLYRTGDLARYRPSGEIEFVGRIDQQVKLRGYRIELGEVEAALLGHAAVAQAAVVKRGEGAEARLVAYVVPTTDHRPLTTDHRLEDKESGRAGDTETIESNDPLSPSLLLPFSPSLQSSLVSHLRDYLKQTLPEYMLPAHFVVLDRLPLTPNGKLDRAALPEPQQERPADARPFRAPRISAEQQLAEIWRELLEIDQISIDDNFFELGGHSLLLTQLASRIRSTFQVDLSLRVLFDAPTIIDMTIAIAAWQMEQEDPAEVARMLQEVQQWSAEDIETLLATGEP